MLALDGRNFHGWGYRRTVVERIEEATAALDPTHSTNASSLAQSEFDYTTKMISSNLSNFSAWHARSRLLPRLLSEQNASAAVRIAAYDAEIALLTRALYTDPYDQSLWTYHQFLMTAVDHAPAAAAAAGKDHTAAPTGILGDAADIDEATRRKYLEAEGENLREMLDGAEDCKYIYQALLENGRRLNSLVAGGDEEDAVLKEKTIKEEMRTWLAELKKLDPLRSGRWEDLERKLDLA
jgi:geranylgeranyl transferase type-2 subunit alpha